MKRSEREIEYKFCLPDANAHGSVAQLLESEGYKIEAVEPRLNEDLYLDTFDWRLFGAGLALRLRKSLGSLAYTMKSVGTFESGKADRVEIELPAPPEAAADPGGSVPPEIDEKISGITRPRRLLAQVKVRTERRPFAATCPGGAKVELAFDSTGFSAAGFNQRRRARRQFELEAELLEGDEAALSSLASLLSLRFGFKPSASSKLQTALERLAIRFPSKNPSPALRVWIEDRLDLGLRKIVSFQTSRIREHLPGLRADLDTEFVHQTRVATRRIRSAIRLFEEAVPARALGSIYQDLGWIAGLLGGVRDLDAFMLALPGFVDKVGLAAEGFHAGLSSWLEIRRASRLEELMAGLEAARFKRLMEKLEAFAESPLPRSPSSRLALAPVRLAYPGMVMARLDAVLKKGRKVLAKPDMRGFHKLRIFFKKLRYACEFVAGAFGGALVPFIAEMVTVQDCLGELQDTVFARGVLEEVLNDWKTKSTDPAFLFSLGELFGLQGRIAAERMALFNEIWKDFDRKRTRTMLADALKGPAAPGQ